MYRSLEWIQEEEIWENARVNPFVSPCPKTCCRTNTLWNKSLSPHSTFSVPQLKKECLLRFHLLWLHLWRWLNRLGLYALEAIRDRTRRSDAVQMSTLSFLRNCLLHEHRIKETCDIMHHGRLTFEGLIKLSLNWNTNTGGPYKGTETHYVTMPLAVEHANLKRCCFHFNIQLWHILGITTGNSTKLLPSSSGFYSTPWNYPSLLFILQNLRLALLFWYQRLFLNSLFFIKKSLASPVSKLHLHKERTRSAFQKSTSKVLRININNKTTGSPSKV